MGTYEDAFRELWTRARQRHGVAISYEVDPDFEAGVRNGSHEPALRVDGYPDIPAKIRLYREASHLPAPCSEPDVSNAEADLCTLAHEMGHELSAQAMSPEQLGDQHRASKRHPPNRSERDKTLLIEEEERAWGCAASILTEIGIDPEAWDVFQRRRRDGLAAWRERLARGI